MSLRILLTGFRPWQGVDYNPSGVVAARLDGEVIHGSSAGTPLRAKVTSRVLDVAWDRGKSSTGEVQGAARVLARDVATLRPHILLALGVAPSEPRLFDVEAIAADSASGEDVRGMEPKTPRRHTRWPRLIVVPFPAKPVIAALVGAGHEAQSVFGAGGYLCEQVAYESARLARLRDTSLSMAGFIHVPNPMVRLGLGTDTSIETLNNDAARAKDLEDVHDIETEMVGAIRLALQTCVSQLTLDGTGRPKRWSLRRDWLPDVTFPNMGRIVRPDDIPGDRLPRAEQWP